MATFWFQNPLQTSFWFQNPFSKKKKEEDEKTQGSTIQESNEKRQTDMFPWLSKEQSKKIVEHTQTLDLSPQERLKAQQEIYQQALPMVRNQQVMEQRTAMTNKLYEDSLKEPDKQKKEMMQMTVRWNKFVDSLKVSYNIPADADDEDVMVDFLNTFPEKKSMLESYIMNWDKTIWYDLGFEERPETTEHWTWIRQLWANVLWAAWDSAVWLWKFGGEVLWEAVARTAKKLWADEWKTDELLEQWKEQLAEWMPSQSYKSDTDSVAYRATKWVWDIAQVATPWGLGRWWVWVFGKASDLGTSLVSRLKGWAKEILSRLWLWSKKSERGAELISKMIQRWTEWATDMALFGAVSGEETTADDIVLWATVWAAIPMAWVVAKWLTKSARSAIEQILWATTNKWRAAISETIDKAWRSKDFTQAMRGNMTVEDVLKNVEEWLNNLKSSSRALYGESYDKLLKHTEALPLREWEASVFSKLEQRLNNARVDITDEWFNFTQSTIQNATDQSKIQQVYNLVRWREDTTPAGLDALKQAIRNTYNFKADSSLVQKFVTETANDVSNMILDTVPEYATMMKKYSQFKSILDDVSGALSIWTTKAKRQTAVTKLQRALKDNQEFRKTMLDTINQYSNDDIVAQLAGVHMWDIMPWGIMRVFGGWGIWAAAAWLINPEFIAGLLVMSPRVVWEIATVLNISTDLITKAAKNAAKFVPEEVVNVWLTKALSDNK